MITEILIVCNVFLLLTLFFSLYKLFKFSMLLINLEDTLEECLDILDERYKSMSEILEIPVFLIPLKLEEWLMTLEHQEIL